MKSLASLLPWRRSAGPSFPRVIDALKLPAAPRILDVGAGGFQGETTTVHLIQIPNAVIDAVELDPSRAAALQAKFGDRINVIQGNFLTIDLPRQYDLVVLDLDAFLIPDIFRSWLPGRVKSVLAPQGKAITLCFGLAPERPDPAFGLADDVRILARQFLLEDFGTATLDEAAVRNKFARDPDFEVVTMQGKHGRLPEAIVWIGLAQRPALATRPGG